MSTFVLATLPSLLLPLLAVGRPTTGLTIFQGNPPPISPTTLVARRSGLPANSALLAINGQPLALDEAWPLHRLPGLSDTLGDTNLLRVELPHGEHEDVAIPVHRYGWADAFRGPTPTAAIGVLFALTALAAFLANPFQRESWALFAFGVLAGGAITTYAAVSYFPWVWPEGHPLHAAHVFVDALHLILRWVVPGACVHLTLAFPVVFPVLIRHRLLPAYMYAGLLIPGVLTILVHPLQLVDPGPATGLSIIVGTAVLLAVSVVCMWGRYVILAVFGRHPVVRQRARILLLGTVVGFGPFIGILVAGVILKGRAVTLDAWAYAPILLFPLALAYTVVRHDLFDTRVAVRRTVGYGLMTLISLGLVWAAAQISPVLAALAVLPLLLAWPRFHARITRLLYPKRQEFAVLQRDISDRLAEASSVEEVVATLAEAPVRVCDSTHGVAFLLPGTTGRRGCVRGAGDADVQALTNLHEEALVQMLVASRQPIKREAIRVDARFAAIKEEAVACMDRCGASVLVPLLRDGKVVGGLAIGRPARGDVHDPRAIEVLTSIMHEAARALRYLELRQSPILPAAGRADARPFVDTPTQPSRLMTDVLPAPGAASGRYDVTRLLGAGAHKNVYLAHDTLLDRDVAFAVIKPEMVDGATRERVRREVQAMARLGDHPHIVTVYDFEERDGQIYIVSQYMGGGDLHRRLVESSAGRLPVREALQIARDLCRALQHAHAHGILHRDVKPANVWLTAEETPGGWGNRAKLGDFGLALSGYDARLTQEGTVVGTAAYMAPEIIRGEPPVPQSDLYSLGVVLYEMLTGQLPFHAESPTGLLRQHLHGLPQAPSALTPEVPRVVDRLVLDLLAKQPQARPVSAEAVAEMLERFLTPSDAATTQLTPTLDSGATHAPSPKGLAFVGREAELARVRANLSLVFDGQGRVLLFSGEPGIGKTRFVTECAHLAERMGARALWGRCYEGEGAPAFWPWMQIIRAYVEDAHPDRLREVLREAAPQIGQLVPEVRTRLPEIPIPSEVDPGVARFLLFEGVTRFLTRAARQEPLVLIMDDLHWADKSSLLLLQFVARELAHTPLLVLGTYRELEIDRTHPLTETLGQLAGQVVSERVRLTGLSAQAVTDLVQDVMPSDEDLEVDLANTVYAQTDGNPLFIKQMLRHLADTGRVSGELHGVPEGVRDCIRLRLARLSDACLELLSMASISGREFELAVLERVGEFSDGDALAQVEEAAHAGLVEEIGDRVGSFRFVHALVQETLYEELSLARRAQLHHDVGLALEAAHAPNLEPYLSALSYHFAKGARAGMDVEKAVEYAMQAGQWATSRAAYDEAIIQYERALSALESTEYSDERPRCRMLLALGHAYANAGQPGSAVETFMRARDLAHALRLVEPLAEATFWIGNLRVSYAAVDRQVLRLAEEGLTLLPETDSPERSMLLAQMSLCLSAAGAEPGRADALSTDALAMAHRISSDRALLYALLSRVELATLPPDNRVRLAEEMLRIGERLDHPEWIGLGLMRRATSYLELGDREAFERDAQALQRLTDRVPLPRNRWNAHVAQATLALLDGRFEDAESAAAEGFEHGRQFRERNAFQTYFTQLFIIRFAQGTLGELEPQIRAAVETFPDEPHVGIARLLLEAALGDLERTRTQWEGFAARDFAQLPQDRVLQLWHAGLAEVAIALGDARRCALLYDRLRPYAGRTITMGGGSACLGAADYWLGLLAHVRGDCGQARQHFETALVVNTRLRAAPFLARTQAAYARCILDHGGIEGRDPAHMFRAALDTAAALGMPALRRDAEAGLRTAAANA